MDDTKIETGVSVQVAKKRIETGNQAIAETIELCGDVFSGFEETGCILIVNLSLSPLNASGKIYFKYKLSQSWEYIKEENITASPVTFELTSDMLSNINVDGNGLIIGGVSYYGELKFTSILIK